MGVAKATKKKSDKHTEKNAEEKNIDNGVNGENPMKLSDVSKPSNPTKIKESADNLEHNFSAISLSFTWLGNKRSLSQNQKQETAELFHAERTRISASKNLFDTKHPAFKEVTRIKGDIYQFWRLNSLPFPEEGIRLFKKDVIAKVVERFRSYEEELSNAVTVLNNHYDQLIENARASLGSLFDPSEYPASLEGQFGFAWDFHNVSPPPYLLTIDPKLYEEQKARMEARFAEAVQLAEAAFLEEFTKLVTKLTERLTKNEDGEVKIFHASTVTNLSDFFDRFKNLNLNSNAQLDKLVEDAKGMLHGVDPADLRGSVEARQMLANNLKGVEESLASMMVNRPRRTINRGKVVED